MATAVSTPHSCVPVIRGLVGDVTELIVASLDRPAMRSMARASKLWNQYLKKEWHLHKQNCDDAIQLINSSVRPRLRLRRCMDKIARVAPAEEAQFFATVACYGVTALEHSAMADMMTVFSAAIKRPLPDSLQCTLQHMKPWDELPRISKKHITRLIDSTFEKDSDRKTRLGGVLAAIRELPDRAKNYALMKLMSGFSVKRDFSNNKGDFWVGEERLATQFIRVAHELVPKTWHRRLACREKYSLPMAGFFSKTFIGMAILCLKKFHRNEELGAALLRLVITSARNLPEGRRNWKGLRASVTKKTEYEFFAINNLIYAVLNLCLRNKKTKHAYTKIYKDILCGSGFLSEGKWIKSREYSRYFAINKALVPYY